MNPQKIDEIVRYLCDELGGEWLLTGGALVQLIFNPARGTEDVDFVRISHPTLSDEATRNRLFQWLIARGLGPEWVNPAVEPFVREAQNWEKFLVLIREGAAGRVYRPALTLFVYLKLRRGSEIDLMDVQSARLSCPEGFDSHQFRIWATPEIQERFEKHRCEWGFPSLKGRQ